MTSCLPDNLLSIPTLPVQVPPIWGRKEEGKGGGRKGEGKGGGRKGEGSKGGGRKASSNQRILFVSTPLW